MGSPAPRFPASAAYERPLPRHFSRPLGISILAVLNAIGALFALLGAVLVVLAGVASSGDAPRGASVVLIVIGVCYGLVGVFQIATAIGLWSLKNYGRVCQLIAAALSLIAIPVGTIIGGLILYYLTRPGVKLLFSGAAPADLTPEERQIVARDADQGAIVVIMLIVVVFGGIAMIGIIAAIAIPGLLRARMAGNEASAIASLRAMTSAQVAWSSSHNGAYGEPSCLGNPAACRDTTSQSPYLSPDLASLREKSGYRFGFLVRAPRMVVAGAAPPAHDPAAGASGESGEPTAADQPSDAEVQRQLEAIPGAQPALPVEPQRELQPGGFTYWAVPVNPRVTGNRSFCTDETGVIRQYLELDTWTEPTGDHPTCPEEGRPLP
jgi:hypothetical protein